MFTASPALLAYQRVVAAQGRAASKHPPTQPTTYADRPLRRIAGGGVLSSGVARLELPAKRLVVVVVVATPPVRIFGEGADRYKTRESDKGARKGIDKYKYVSI